MLGRIHEMVREVGDRVRVTPEHLNFLEQRLSPEDYKLGHCLTTLVEQDVDVDLRAVLTEMVDPLPDVLVLEGINHRQTAWEAMGTVRNRISHGKTPVPPPVRSMPSSSLRTP